MISSLDHVVLAVANLEGSSKEYRALLGRDPSWRGQHPTFGTRNTLYRLDNTYLELLAAVGDGTLAGQVRETLRERAERPFALALAVDDMDTALVELRRRGLRIGDAAEGSGTDDDTGVRRTWRSAFIHGAATRGLRLFLIQHTSPPALLPPAPMSGEAASVATGVDHVVVVTQDIDASRALWVDVLGVPEAWRREFPERGTRNLGLDLGGIIVELLQRTDRAASDRPDSLWGVAYRVGDADAAAARARTGGFDVDAPRPGLMLETKVATVRWPRTATLLIAKT